jgi:hypothetical protein
MQLAKCGIYYLSKISCKDNMEVVELEISATVVIISIVQYIGKKWIKICNVDRVEK